MSKETILMMHPTFGVLGMIAVVWVFVEALNAQTSGAGGTVRINRAALIGAVMIWLAYIVGGYWYVVYYGADKAIIKAGPWPFAHGLFMETKEHLFFMTLMLATFLPIATAGDAVKRVGGRTVVLWSSALLVLMILAMEGAGAFISMGAKVGLQANMG